MTTINTIEDLVRILREQPAWADTLRALLLTEDLLDLPARFDRFVQSQEETNRAQEETNQRLTELLAQQSEQLAQLNQAHDDTRQRLIGLEERFERFVQSQEETNRRLSEMLAQQSELLAELKEISEDTRRRFARMEGRFGNFEGIQYERVVRPKAMARSHIVLGFEAFYIALSQEAGRADPRLMSTIARANRDKLVTTADSGDLFETDLIISDEENRHAVFEISLTADTHDVRRARQRANILETITGGDVTPVVITARIDDARSEQAEAEGVTVFVIPYS